MILTRHKTPSGAARWAVDGRYLPPNLTLSVLLGLPRAQALRLIADSVTSLEANDELLAPVEGDQEVWACGVTYLRSRDARTGNQPSRTCTNACTKRSAQRCSSKPSVGVRWAMVCRFAFDATRRGTRPSQSAR